jgi:predicted nucleic acid-binding protein
VANASPIIVLAKAGYLDLLQKLPVELFVPEQVADEILAGPTSDPARQLFEKGWGKRITPATVPTELLEWGLGTGETSVLALAFERKPATAVLDDAAARACSKALGVPLIGTLGVILRAKKHKLVSQAADVLRAVRSAGLHLDDRTIRLALGRIGEDWETKD